MAYTYIPIDPLRVRIKESTSCDSLNYFYSFPDQAVRLAIGEFNASGQLSFGPLSTGYEGRQYQVILDYISVDVAELYVKSDLIVESDTNYVSFGEAIMSSSKNIEVVDFLKVVILPAADKNRYDI